MKKPIDKKRKEEKGEGKPSSLWDKRVGDLVLSAVAGLEGMKPQMDENEGCLEACGMLQEVVDGLSRKLEADFEWAFRLRREGFTGGTRPEATFRLLLSDQKTMAIVESLLAISVTSLQVCVYARGSHPAFEATSPIDRKNLEKMLVEALFSPACFFSRFLLWKIHQSQGGRDR